MHMRVSLVFGIAAVAASVGLAGADEFKPPPMRDGFWDNRSALTVDGKLVSDTSIKMCQSKELTQSTEAAAAEIRKKNECTEVVTKTSANTIVEESRCAKGPNAGSDTKGVYSYTGDTAGHIEMHIHKGSSETVMVMDMKYLGSCPLGMKPGDAIMPDGKKLALGGK
jgi:hypothetical protein